MATRDLPDISGKYHSGMLTYLKEDKPGTTALLFADFYSGFKLWGLNHPHIAKLYLVTENYVMLTHSIHLISSTKISHVKLKPTIQNFKQLYIKN